MARSTYYVSYSGTYEGGEQFSDGTGNAYTRKAEAIKAAKEFEANMENLRGPDDQKIVQLYVYVADERGSMVYG